MPDDHDVQVDEQEAAQDQPTAAAAEASGGGLLTRGRLLRLGALTLLSFLIAGIIALSRGGHFQRPPLNRLRGVPLVGGLIPAPEEPAEPRPEEPPNVAAVHPMSATEISQLVQQLQTMWKRLQERQAQLAQQQERLKALQADLRRERDILDELRTKLASRQETVAEERAALEADLVVAKAEERKRLNQLAKIYEAQEAATAATELASLDESASDGVAVKILGSMSEKKAAPIFDAMPPETAARLKTRLLKLRFEVGKKKEGAS
ncbi:MAG: MotE family protein [Planctomycetota bacterium]